MALKARPDEQARLLDLQTLDTRVQQLDHRARALPELAAITALSAEAERLRIRRVSESGVAEDTRTELARVESDVAVVEARIVRDDQRLQSSSSTRDVAGLESELTTLRRRLGELEEMELAVMERLEDLEGAERVLTEEQEGLTARLAEVESARDAALTGIRSEREDAAANRASIAAGLSPDLLALYERQRQRYGFGASLLRGGVSGASGVKLLENELAQVRAASPDDVLICPDSQAILVRTDESGL